MADDSLWEGLQQSVPAQRGFWDGLPQSANVDDRRDSLLDNVLTQLRYPMRKDWVEYQRWGDPSIKFPQIAADFPLGTPSPPTPLGVAAGYADLKPDQQSVPVQKGLWDGLYDPATGMPYPGNAPDYGDLSQRMTNFEQRLPGHIASGIRDWVGAPGRQLGTVPGGPLTPEEEMDWSRGTALGQLGMARMPGMAGTGAVGAGGAKLVQPEGIFAYHSSPYTFDKFDLSKIGTGEGAQVYGHGIYAAENPAVSGQGGQYWSSFVNRFAGTPEEVAAKRLYMLNFDRDAALAQSAANLRDLRHQGYSLTGNHAAEMAQEQAVIDLLKSGNPVGPRTYEVNINARPEQLLNYDQMLSKQGELGSRALDIMAPFGNEPKVLYRNPQVTERLADAGIPGIRYLDQGSRPLSFDTQRVADLNAQVGKLQRWIAENPTDIAAQTKLATLEKAASAYKPTSNYVIFDPNKIDIRKMYAVPGAVGAGAAATGSMWDSLFPQREEQ